MLLSGIVLESADLTIVIVISCFAGEGSECVSVVLIIGWPWFAVVSNNPVGSYLFTVSENHKLSRFLFTNYCRYFAVRFFQMRILIHIEKDHFYRIFFDFLLEQIKIADKKLSKEIEKTLKKILKREGINKQ